MRILLDAGHYAKENTGAIAGYYESEMNWKLHLFLKAELEKRGFEVGTTRADQKKDLAVIKRGEMAKDYDLFLSLHSNYVTDEKVNRVVVIYPVSGAGKPLADKLGKAITQTMGITQPYQLYQRAADGKPNTDYYGVIRGATSVGTLGIILEHSFHSNKYACEWLMKDSNLQKLAVAEAKVIADYYGVTPPEPEMPEKPMFADVPKTHWAYEAIKALTDAGIVVGYPNSNDFKPSQTATRAEVAQIIYRLMNK